MTTRTMFRTACLAAALLVPIAAIATENDGDRKKQSERDRKNKIVNKIVINTGHRSYLGVGTAEVDEDRAKELRLKEEYGVEIKTVEEGSPAAKAGLKEGDVVLAFNGDRVEGTAQFSRMVRETPAGREVKLLISRGGSNQTLDATIGTRKPRVFRWKGDGNSFRNVTPDAPGLFDYEDDDAEEGSEGGEVEEMEFPDVDLSEIEIPEVHVPDLPRVLMSWGSPRLGIESEGLSPQLAEFFGVKEGVLVRSVNKDTAAERAGLKAGDVILKVETKKVTGPGQISSILRTLTRDKPFPIVIVRNGKEMTLSAKLDEDKGWGHGTKWRYKSPRRSGSDHEHDRDDEGDPT